MDAWLASVPDGLFHNVLDQPESFVETNLAQILAFTIYTGVPGGWLPASYAQPRTGCAPPRAPRWTNSASCRGSAAPPAFDHAGVAAEGQAFFLMMEVAGANFDRVRARREH